MEPKIIAEENYIDKARILAERLNTEYEAVPDKEINRSVKRAGVPVLLLTKKGLSLTDGETSLFGDFTAMERRIKKNNLYHEMIVKAAKFKKMQADLNREELVAFDATAGLGEDSLLLAAVGFQVDCVEHNPITFLLLSDALERAKAATDCPAVCEAASRMRLHQGESIEILRRLAGMAREQEDEEATGDGGEVAATRDGGEVASVRQPDVIFLDPMFPERKKSSLVKKKLQMIQSMEPPASEEVELLEAAKAAAPSKIIVKRPVKGEHLAGEKPDYSIEGKVIRYDLFKE